MQHGGVIDAGVPGHVAPDRAFSLLPAGEAGERVLRVEADSPAYSKARFGHVPLLHTTATHDEEAGTITVFTVNRSRTQTLPLEVDLRGSGPPWVVQHLRLTGEDRDAANTLASRERGAPRAIDASGVTGAVPSSSLPPLSWNVIRP